MLNKLNCLKPTLLKVSGETGCSVGACLDTDETGFNKQCGQGFCFLFFFLKKKKI